MTNHAEEFKKPGISASSLNAYHKSPAHFWRDSSYNPKRIRKEQTPAMLFGLLAHCLVLTPDEFDREFIIAPEINRRTNEGKSGWENFLRVAGNRKVVTIEQFDRAIEMRDAMFANAAVRALIGNGVSESPMTWKRPDGDLMCKCRLDYVRSGLVIEYKTTQDARLNEFSRSIASYGYHRQMAWEMDAATAMNGEQPRGAVIIAQDSDLPEAIGVFALDSAALSAGHNENSAYYREICDRMKHGNWKAFPEEIVPISLPAWYR